MELQDITLRLSPATVAALTGMASKREVSPGELVRELIVREAKRNRKSTAPKRADKPLVAHTRQQIAAALAGATGWADLGERLRRMGCDLRPAGGGLRLEDRQGRSLGTTAALGHSYQSLTDRFGTDMPGLPFWRGDLPKENAVRRKPDGDDPVLIEPF